MIAVTNLRRCIFRRTINLYRYEVSIRRDAQTVENAHFAVINMATESVVHHTKEDVQGEEGVGPGLMHLAVALAAENLGEFVQSAVQIVRTLHEILEVVKLGEEELEQLEELAFARRQRQRGEDLEQVAKVVAAVEGNPFHAVVQHESRGDEQLAKGEHVDAAPLVRRKVQAVGGEQVDGVLGVHVVRKIEGKVELPGGALVRGLAVGVGQGDSELNYLEQVDVAAQRLILEVKGARRNRARNDTRELGVHRHVVVVDDQLADARHLFFQVVRPYLANSLRVWWHRVVRARGGRRNGVANTAPLTEMGPPELGKRAGEKRSRNLAYTRAGRVFLPARGTKRDGGGDGGGDGG